MTVGEMIRSMDNYRLARYLTEVEMAIIRKKPTLTKSEIFFDWLETLQRDWDDS